MKNILIIGGKGFTGPAIVNKHLSTHIPKLNLTDEYRGISRAKGYVDNAVLLIVGDKD